MTTYKFPPEDKTLYGLTTGTVYNPEEGHLAWEAEGKSIGLYNIAAAEPDGVTDVPPLKVGDTISTVKELDALPSGTILRDESGAREKIGGLFYSIADEVPSTGPDLASDNMLTILWLPETGERA